ncbi:hypothetical protein JZ751_001901 [Albula glossodonta]|uniref:Alkaline phosphatase n=1 Tax=Albula glossodonta TaxID=121402 RepID=A0A8T2P900_9TELE|nr:hypothetical protein JZ751_001901 [Albula glossodonta]
MGGGRQFMTPAGTPDPVYPNETRAHGLRLDGVNLIDKWKQLKGDKATGKIDHGHHMSQAKLALYDTILLDKAVERAAKLTNESETLTVLTADHSHTLNMGGETDRGNPILGLVPVPSPIDGMPYTTLLYGNGPGFRLVRLGTGSRQQFPSLKRRTQVMKCSNPKGGLYSTVTRPSVPVRDQSYPQSIAMETRHLSAVLLCLLFSVCMAAAPAEEENPEFWRKQAQQVLRSALSRKLNTNVYCVDFQIPDSAATATAYLCGVKSNLNTVGLSAAGRNGVCKTQKGNEVTSILKWAKDAGKSVGIVTTTRVQHATPAASYAHSASRTWYTDADMPNIAKKEGCTDIASQLLNNTDIDVIIGGGRKYMTPKGTRDPEYPSDPAANGQRTDGRNLILEWLKMKEGKVAHYVWNRTDFDAVDPATTDYLMGGRIDQGHHASRASMALHETVALDNAVARALELTSEDDTLTMVTADHSHSLSFNGYPFRGNSILGKSPLFGTDMLPYTTLMYGNGPGHKIIDNKRPDIRRVNTGTKDYVQQAAAPLKSETHGGEDVAVMARGPMSHLFHGIQEQSYIPYALAYAACIGQDRSHCLAHLNPSPSTSTPRSTAPAPPFAHLASALLAALLAAMLH